MQTSRPGNPSGADQAGPQGEPVVTVRVRPGSGSLPHPATSTHEERGETGRPEEVTEGEPSFGGPRWPYITGLVLSVLGFAVAGYLTFEHYTGSTSLTCPAGSANGAINCLKVTTSVYSMQYGIPIAVLGLVFFAAMAALQSPWAWRSDRRWLGVVRIAWCVVGIASALKLVYDELFNIHAICLWCTSVHILTLLIFVATLFGTLSWAAHRDRVYDNGELETDVA